MNQTEDIKELVSALAKAQGKMEPAKFNRVNPHFKNRYADFTSCMDACRVPLADNGLAVLQYCDTINEKLTLVTTLAHTSGQWIKSYFPLNPKTMDSQSIGSAMTYAKRYSLSAMLGIVSDEEEDDDGETAHGRGRHEAQKLPPLQKLNSVHLNVLKKLNEKLDQDCRDRLFSWLNSTFRVTSLEDLVVDVYPKVLAAFENAAKFMEQQKIEALNGEKVNA